MDVKKQFSLRLKQSMLQGRSLGRKVDNSNSFRKFLKLKRFIRLLLARVSLAKLQR